jgi:hypothetical protein
LPIKLGINNDEPMTHHESAEIDTIENSNQTCSIFFFEFHKQFTWQKLAANDNCIDLSHHVDGGGAILMAQDC